MHDQLLVALGDSWVTRRKIPAVQLSKKETWRSYKDAKTKSESETDHDLPTQELLQQGNILSLHQLSTYTTLVELHETMLAGRPVLAAKKCCELPNLRTKQGALREKRSRMSLRQIASYPDQSRSTITTPRNSDSWDWLT